jgi:hypothetical protein
MLRYKIFLYLLGLPKIIYIELPVNALQKLCQIERSHQADPGATLELLVYLQIFIGSFDDGGLAKISSIYSYDSKAIVLADEPNET